jgi:hypothetical protein
VVADVASRRCAEGLVLKVLAVKSDLRLNRNVR